VLFDKLRIFPNSSIRELRGQREVFGWFEGASLGPDRFHPDFHRDRLKFRELFDRSFKVLGVEGNVVSAEYSSIIEAETGALF
jgi:hypothetical protein